jgi:hypothetical protein
VADEYEHFSSKNRSPSNGPQNKLAIFKKKSQTILNKLWYFMETISLNENV